MKKIIISGCYKLHLIIGINNVIVLKIGIIFRASSCHLPPAFSDVDHLVKCICGEIFLLDHQVVFNEHLMDLHGAR